LGLGLAAFFSLTMNLRTSDYDSDRQRVRRDGHFRRTFLSANATLLGCQRRPLV